MALEWLRGLGLKWLHGLGLISLVFRLARRRRGFNGFVYFVSLFFVSLVFQLARCLRGFNGFVYFLSTFAITVIVIIPSVAILAQDILALKPF